jgi:hypothetical protein
LGTEVGYSSFNIHGFEAEALQIALTKSRLKRYFPKCFLLLDIAGGALDTAGSGFQARRVVPRNLTKRSGKSQLSLAGQA